MSYFLWKENNKVIQILDCIKTGEVESPCRLAAVISCSALYFPSNYCCFRDTRGHSKHLLFLFSVLFYWVVV